MTNVYYILGMLMAWFPILATFIDKTFGIVLGVLIYEYAFYHFLN